MDTGIADEPKDLEDTEEPDPAAVTPSKGKGKAKTRGRARRERKSHCTPSGGKRGKVIAEDDGVKGGDGDGELAQTPVVARVGQICEDSQVEAMKGACV